MVAVEPGLSCGVQEAASVFAGKAADGLSHVQATLEKGTASFLPRAQLEL
jgi:hypothetical protein